MQLFKSLNILASKKNQQIDYLLKLGTYPSTDEFALEFDDAYKVFISNNEEKKDHNLLLNRLYEINFIFTKMSDIINNDFWNISSLELKEWNKMRELASEALQYLNDYDGSDIH